MDRKCDLLPMPRQISWNPGFFKTCGDVYISLVGSITPELLRTGKVVQDALEDTFGFWELTAGAAGRPAAVVIAEDPALIGHSEGYHLTILPGQIRIIGSDAAGVFYGSQTLKQILRQVSGKEDLPCVDILDWPDFSNRGLSADISRDRVPTMEHLYSLIDMISEWKVNQFSLHMEHTFAYRKHRRVWENASPMTGEEIILLDRYCKDRHIELVPYQACFGHMETWFQYEEYQPLAEVPFDWDISDEKFNHAPSVAKHCRSTMNPKDPKTFEFVDGLLGELLPHFTSRQVYLPLDEPMDLTLGLSKQICEQIGLDRVYFEYVRDVARMVEKRGRVLQYWGYPVRTHPEWAREMPAGTIAHTFPHTAERFAGTGIQFYVGSFANGTLSIAGTTDYSTGVVSKGVENALKYGADGVWTYEFGDDGHWHSPPVTLVGYAHSAAVTWGYESNRHESLSDVLNTHVFMDSSGVAGTIACDLGNVYSHPGLDSSAIPEGKVVEVPEGVNGDNLWHILEGAIMLTDPGDRWDSAWDSIFNGDRSLTAHGLGDAADYIDQVISSMPDASMSRVDSGLISDEFRLGASMQKHACRLGQALVNTGGKNVSEIGRGERKKLADELGPIVEEFRRLWLLRSRPGGLSHSAGLLERLLGYYRQ